MNYLQAFILAIIEGITEFLPVSSTGHMIIGSSLMGIAEKDFTKLFTICIQLGAILSVLVLYFKRFLKDFSFYFKLLIAFLPAAFMGKIFGDAIDLLLESVTMVAFSLLAGGIVLVFADRWFKTGENKKEEEMSKVDAWVVGIFQCIALIPGVSRSAATILGGLFRGKTKKTAAEFSFFLAVPTMFAATCYKMFTFYEKGLVLSNQEWGILLFGNLFAFIVAMIAIRGFISYLTSHGFKVFGYYRIGVGLLILLLQAFGVTLKLV